MVELMNSLQFLIEDSTQHFIMRKSLELMMVFGLIFIVLSSPIPIPSEVDEEGNDINENSSKLVFQFLEEPIEGGNIDENVMRDADMDNLDDEFSLNREQIFSEIQLDAAYNYQRDELVFIKL